jgi:NAD(P)-dependent dehydrogenase (short-subunit alcohol dehydrogenase family)
MLLKEGARVVIGYRSNADRAARWKARATVLQADIASAEGRARLLDAAASLYGLVVFAGEPARVRDASELETMMRHSYEVNCLGPILLAREAAARMKEGGTAGAIVLFSTMQANALFPGSTAYAAPKSAVQHAARILAKEYRGAANIRVNAVSPGVTAAGMAEESIAAGKYEGFIRDGVIPRYGRAEDVARAVRFLLEPDSYITGQVLSVDGGMSL